MNRLQKAAANIVSALVVVPVVIVVGALVVWYGRTHLVDIAEGIGGLVVIAGLILWIDLKRTGETLNQYGARRDRERADALAAPKRSQYMGVQVDEATSKSLNAFDEQMAGLRRDNPQLNEAYEAGRRGEGDAYLAELRRADSKQAADDARRLADVQEAARRALAVRRESPSSPDPTD